MVEEKELHLTIENEKCFVKCMGERLSFINSDGSLNATALRHPPSYLNGNKIGAALRKCSRIFGTSRCDKAYQQSICFFNIAGIDVESDEY